MCADLVVPNKSGLFEDEFSNTPLPAPSASSDTQPNSLAATVDSYSDELRTEAHRRLTYIRWIGEHLTGGWTEKNLKPLLSEAASVLPPPVPNWRTLARWYKCYIQHGKKLASLIPKHRAKGNSQSRLPPSDEKYFDQAVRDFFVSEQPSIASTYKDYKDAVVLENINIIENPIKRISKRAFYKRFKKLPTYLVTKGRKGPYTANEEFKAIGSHKPPDRLLERVEIDHTPLDLILLDDDNLVPLGRPTLTLLIDAYSHCVVGFFIGFKQPGYEPVRNALLNAISPKDYIKHMYPAIEHEWPCYGKPETLVVDNGVEFWSDSLEQACRELGINIQYNPVKKPWLKPQVERFFGTINSNLLESIPGKTFSNILKKAAYNPQKDAVIKFSTFLDIFHHWIIDVYHYESDSRERYIPICLWESGYKAAPPATIVGDDLTRLDVILGINIKCSHRRGGIHRFHLRYDSDELAFYRMKYPVHTSGKQKVTVKFNPRDMSYVNVFIDEIDKYIRVPCIDPAGYTANLSLLEHQINVNVQRFLTRDKVDVVSLAKARAYIRGRIKNEILDVRDVRNAHEKRNSKGFNKIAKYLDIGSHTNDGIIQEQQLSIDKADIQKTKQIDQSKSIEDWDSYTSKLDAF